MKELRAHGWAPAIAVALALLLPATAPAKTLKLPGGAELHLAAGVRAQVLKPGAAGRLPNGQQRTGRGVRLRFRGRRTGLLGTVHFPLPERAALLNAEDAAALYTVRVWRGKKRGWQVVPSWVSADRTTLLVELRRGSGRARAAAQGARFPFLFTGPSFLQPTENLAAVTSWILEDFLKLRSPENPTCSGALPGWAQISGLTDAGLAPLRGCARGEGDVAIAELVNNRPFGVVVRYGRGVHFGWSDGGFGLPKLYHELNKWAADGLYIPPQKRASVGVKPFDGTAPFKTGPTKLSVALDFVVTTIDMGSDKALEAVSEQQCKASLAKLVAEDVGINGTDEIRGLVTAAMTRALACLPSVAATILRHTSGNTLRAQRWKLVKEVSSKISVLPLATKLSGLLVDSASGGLLAEFAFHGSTRKPAPSAPSQPATQPRPQPQPATGDPQPPRRVIVVDNRVTNGMGMREDGTPARLTTQPWVFCSRRNCNINGTERGSGGTYDAAVCQAFGERTTNGHDTDASDDGNPERFESTRYYGVRIGNGTFGYVSEVWIRAADRGGLGLPAC